MISREEVVYAYRMILGREPENEAVVAEQVAGFGDLKSLRNGFLHSTEFLRQAVSLIGPEPVIPELQAEQPIDVACSPEQLKRLLASVEATWSQLGKEEPYWSVLTSDRYRSENFSQNEDKYWSTGIVDVRRMKAWLERNGVASTARQRCLEYGCGTGRVTHWLAREFRQVTGCDISQAHLDLAQRAISSRIEPSQEVDFFHVRNLKSLDRLPEFEFLFSFIVLQHNPPPVITYILDKLLARLAEGGIAFFQLPTYWKYYTFTTQAYLSRKAAVAGTDSQMEMHVVPQRYIFEIARRHGCKVLEVQPDGMASSREIVSHTFLLRKSS